MKATRGKENRNRLLLNEDGFTLVEALVSFMAFCMVISFMPLAMKTVLQFDSFERKLQRMEWEVFYSQIKKEVRVSSNIKVEKEKIILEKNGDFVIYEKYGSNIRRRVNSTGHEITLQRVASVHFESLRTGVSIAVEDKSGYEYEANIRTIVDVGIKNDIK